MSLTLRLSSNDRRVLREARIVDALTSAIHDKVITVEEERVLWKSLTYLMNDKKRVIKLKFILTKLFGSVRQYEITSIMLKYFRRIDALNRNPN